MEILLAEHQSCTIRFSDAEEENLGVYCKRTQTLSLSKTDYEKFIVNPRVFKVDRGKTLPCFDFAKGEVDSVIEAGFYIGVDWLINNERYIQIEPKLNSSTGTFFNEILELDDPENEDATQQIDEKIASELKASGTLYSEYKEVDYLKMLLDAMTDKMVVEETEKLVFIDWEAPEIDIRQNQDKLTPFLVVQFLNLLRIITRKGLKKSYYVVQEHLNSRIKGKVLIAGQIKENVLKNRFNKTYCQYQVFGVDYIENRFLKTVLQFSKRYVEDHSILFGDNLIKIRELIAYVSPPFNQVGILDREDELRHFKYNPFYKEYKDAVRIGNYILKRFSYHISQASKEFSKTPPFWIDMPRLFELYVYQNLLINNLTDQQHIHFQFSTHGNALDYLISKPGFEMVIDAKYKSKYISHLVHQDVRQVSGYARLNKVLKKVNIIDENGSLKKIDNQLKDALIDCLIIYPDLKAETFDLTLENIRNKRSELKAYHRVFKLGVKLPLIE